MVGLCLGLRVLRSMKTWNLYALYSYTLYVCPIYFQPRAQMEQPVPIPDDDSVQATFQQQQNPPSPARPRLLQDTVRQLMQPHGRLSLVTGQSGQGKTAFLV